jgi:hypothetical protein
MVRAGWIEAERPSSRKTNPALLHEDFFGLLRREKSSFRGARSASPESISRHTCCPMDSGLDASHRPGMTGESIAFRSGTNSHQIAFPTTAPADIIGFK